MTPNGMQTLGLSFFVLECKGVKLWAKASVFNDIESLVDILLHGIPCLDWPYMVDWDNGELLIDLGIGIHPTCSQKIVGLCDWMHWKPPLVLVDFCKTMCIIHAPLVNMGEFRQRCHRKEHDKLMWPQLM